jgi:FixJ family two-component response regulator
MATQSQDTAPDGIVLVVDDDPALRSSLEFSLRIEGYTVRTFGNASELLEEPSLPGHGCMVIDQRLPDMTGLDLIDILRKRAIRLPAILVTTNPSKAIQRQAADAGIPIVEKPLLTGALFHRIITALETQR